MLSKNPTIKIGANQVSVRETFFHLTFVSYLTKFRYTHLFKKSHEASGANNGNRTRDLTLTMGVLYRLSYVGTRGIIFFSSKTQAKHERVYSTSYKIKFPSSMYNA